MSEETTSTTMGTITGTVLFFMAVCGIMFVSHIFFWRPFMWKMDSFEARLDSFEARLESLESKPDLKSRIDFLESRLGSMPQSWELKTLESRLDSKESPSLGLDPRAWEFDSLISRVKSLESGDDHRIKRMQEELISLRCASFRMEESLNCEFLHGGNGGDVDDKVECLKRALSQEVQCLDPPQ